MVSKIFGSKETNRKKYRKESEKNTGKKYRKESGKNVGKNSVPNEIEFRAIIMGKIHDKIKFTTKSNLYAN